MAVRARRQVSAFLQRRPETGELNRWASRQAERYETTQHPAPTASTAWAAAYGAPIRRQAKKMPTTAEFSTALRITRAGKIMMQRAAILPPDPPYLMRSGARDVQHPFVRTDAAPSAHASLTHIVQPRRIGGGGPARFGAYAIGTTPAARNRADRGPGQIRGGPRPRRRPDACDRGRVRTPNHHRPNPPRTARTVSTMNIRSGKPYGSAVDTGDYGRAHSVSVANWHRPAAAGEYTTAGRHPVK